MKTCTHRSSTLALYLGLALLGPVICSQAGPDKSAGTAPAVGTTNAAAPAEIPLSVFVIPTNPKEGRNPFFPMSTMGVEQPVRPKDAPIDTSSFTLNGITSPPKPTAMINNRTFEQGEEAEVKLPSGGKALIKCETIKTDAAVILYAGQRRELKLRNGVL